MDDRLIARLPPKLAAIEAESESLGFAQRSEQRTGALLRALAASKPGGRMLELGTGTGVGTAWLLDGMDAEARLTTIDIDAEVSGIAARFLGDDPRLTILVEDALSWLRAAQEGTFDLIFADSLIGKFESFEAAWRLLAPGGLYVGDDLLPQPSWPEGHESRVAAWLEDLDRRSDCILLRLCWSSGLLILVRT